MKTIVTFLFVVFLGSIYSQFNVEGPSAIINGTLKRELSSIRNNSYSGPRCTPNILHSENFSNPFSNGWSITGSGSSNGTYSASQLWLHDLDGPNGFYSSTSNIIQSTSVNDGFMILDGDFVNGAGAEPIPANVESFHAELESPVYDLSSVSNVTLSFEHSYRICCSPAISQLWLEVSTDGFLNVSGAYDCMYAFAGINEFSGTQTKYINITNAIQGNPSNVQVRFRWGESGATTNASHYFWQIDDLTFFESFTHHTQMDSLNWSPDITNYGIFSGFRKIPVSFASHTDLNVSANTINVGSSNFTNAVLNVEQNGTSFSTSSPQIVNIGDTSSRFISSAPMPTSLGIYDYDVFISDTSTMCINDTFSFDIEVTNKLYSVAGSNVTGVQSGTNWDWTTQPLRVGFGGEAYMIYGNYPFMVTGVQVAFEDTSLNEFSPMEVVILKNDIEVATKTFFVDGANMGQYQEVLLDAPISFSSGDVVDYLVVDSDGQGRFLESGSKAYSAGLMATYDGANLMSGLYFESPAMIDLIVDQGGSVIEINRSISSLRQNFPNPFTFESTIQFELINQEYCQFEIRDISGKTIKRMDLGSRQKGTHQIRIDGNEFNAGIYFYSLIAGTSKMTKKMVLTK
jgi:hypothetical protein